MQKSSFLFLLILAGVALIGAYQALSDNASSVAIVRFLALSAFFLLCVSLMIGPLAVLRGPIFAQLIEPRRAVGVAAFVFAALHSSLVLSLYFNWNIGNVISMLPLAIAIPAYVILLAMALTSTDWAVAKLGLAKWKTLHRFVYIAFILIFAHFILKSNGLYSRGSASVPLNIAEVALVLLGIATVILQVAGFFIFSKRKAASVQPQNQSSPERI